MSSDRAARQAFITEDLARVAAGLDPSPLRKSCVAITGGSGFMGLWLTELLLHLDRAHGLGLRIRLLARDFSGAKAQAPHLFDAKAPVEAILADVRTLHELPSDAEWVVHAAATPDARIHTAQPILASQTITQGTANVLDCASRLHSLKGLLHVSSGYVYGFHSVDEAAKTSPFSGFDPCVFANAYMESKRYAETLCTLYRNQHRLPVVIARPYSFVGPYQSQDAPWAVNNFIRDAILGQAIRIQGDGLAVRSYMYGADMASWLLTMLLRGPSGSIYDLGSGFGVTLRDLAARIRKQSNSRQDVHFATALPKTGASIFVPSAEQLRSDLGLELKFDLDQALARTLQWQA